MTDELLVCVDELREQLRQLEDAYRSAASRIQLMTTQDHASLREIGELQVACVERVAQEREGCALVAENAIGVDHRPGWHEAAERIAAAIRARGTT